jgi:large subunit ribosomal protein L10
MPTAEKVAVVEDLAERLMRAESVVLTEFRELTVAQTTSMRQALRPRGLELKVVKNTLFRLAAEKAGVVGLEPYLSGTTAVIFGYQDPVEAPKAASEFARTYQKELRVKAGVLGKAVIEAQAVRDLAELPSREVLLARVAGSFQAPLQEMAMLLQAPLRNLAYGLQALATRRAEEASA